MVKEFCELHFDVYRFGKKAKVSESLISIYIHYGGIFKELKTTLNLIYTSDKVKFFADWDIDYISMRELSEMYYST